MILACQSRAQTPVSIDVSIDGEAKVSATKKYMGKVKKVTSLTHDIMELTLEVDGHEHTGAAGQYSEVLVKQVGSTRSYSFAKAPQNENSNELTFYIRNVPKGRFSRWLFGKDPTGQKIEVNTPYGSFYYRDGKGTMVCIAGGSGMSAVKAVLEQAAIDQVQRDAVFLFGARTQEDIYCQAELEEIQKKFWSMLDDAVVNRSSPFRIPVFICTDQNDIDGRIVVLRKSDKENNVLQFHTDLRSPKVDILKKNNKASLLFYDKEEKIQLRVKVDCEINNQNSTTEESWKKTQHISRRCYCLLYTSPSPRD